MNNEELLSEVKGLQKLVNTLLLENGLLMGKIMEVEDKQKTHDKRLDTYQSYIFDIDNKLFTIKQAFYSI